MRTAGYVGTIAAFSFSLLGYFEIHYSPESSAGKNIAVNSLGVFGTAFAFTPVLYFMNVMDPLRLIVNSAFASLDFTSGLPVIFIFLTILRLINITRAILKSALR